MTPGIRAVETPASCVWLDGPALVADVHPNPIPDDPPWTARWMSRRGRMAAWVGRGGGWQARACWSYAEAVAAVDVGLGIKTAAGANHPPADGGTQYMGSPVRPRTEGGYEALGPGSIPCVEGVECDDTHAAVAR